MGEEPGASQQQEQQEQEQQEPAGASQLQQSQQQPVLSLPAPLGDAAAAQALLDAQIAQSLEGNIDVIRESERNKPYVGDLESLDSLKAEYANGSQVFVDKITSLQGSYSQLRRTRGDGNCFFRSFIYRLLEHLLTQQDEDDCTAVLKCLEGWKAKLVEAGFEPIVFEDALEMLLGQVQAILISPTGLEGSMTPQQLLENFRDDTWSNTCVMLLRFITSAEIKRRAEHFEPFVLGEHDQDVATFCQRSVEVMGEESDNIHAQALTDALQVPVRIIYMTAQQGDVPPTDILPEGLSAEQQTAAAREPKVHMLYRPGHYDILMPRAAQ